MVSEQQQTDLFKISSILWTLPTLILVRSALSKVPRKGRNVIKKLFDCLIGSTSVVGWWIGLIGFFETIFPVKYPDALVAYLTCLLSAWQIAVGATIARAMKNYKEVNFRELSKKPMLYVVFSLLVALLLVTLFYCHASVTIYL